MENEVEENKSEETKKEEWSLWHKIAFYIIMPISMMFW